MNEAIDTFSVAQIRLIYPAFVRDLEKHLETDYDKFVERLYEDIDQGVQELEANRELRQNDSEDRLTIELVTFLRARSYSVTHESKVGGHVDLLVENQRHGFKWLGEAKIHSSYAYLLQGFQQLCTRYLPGTSHANKGALLIYIFGANTGDVLKRWRNDFPGMLGQPVELRDCVSPRSPYAFFSTHAHAGTGQSICVRHMAIALHFDPKDKRVAKKASTKRTIKETDTVGKSPTKPATARGAKKAPSRP